MKRGFTLAEVMGVIVIIFAVTLIIVPTVAKQLKDGKQKMYDEQISSIKSSLDLYMNDINLGNNESMIITLYQLKKAGLVDKDIKNPVTEEFFPNDTLITILNDNGILKYNIDDTGSNKTEYESLPEMNLIGNTLEYVELGEDYVDRGSESIFNGKLLNTDVDSNVDSSKVGTYRIIYSTSYENVSNKIIKTVIVKDTKGPTVEFTTLNIPLSQAKTYDYKSDIITDDLSGVKDIIVETNFGALTGTYSVKYTVIDNYDNETVKYRKVVTS